MPPEISQFEWHLKPPKSGPLCPICGCPAKRLRAVHRALTAKECWEAKGFWIKKIRVAFGLDTSIEVIHP
jgi:hypothetical protein